MAAQPDPGRLVRIPAALLAEIKAAARAAAPREACGLLIGRGTEAGYTVTAHVESPNLAARDDRFEIDPRLQLTWQKALRGTGEAVIGHYHSHPGGKAEPSATDIAMAHDPDMLWLILGLEGGACHARAYGIDRQAETVEPVAVEIR